MMAAKSALLALIFLFLIAVTLSGCVSHGQGWTLIINGDSNKTIDGALYGTLKNDSETIDGATGIPLEIFLYYYGVFPVTSVSYDGATYDWETVAYNADKDIPMLVEPDGSLYYSGKTARVTDINVTVAEKPNVSTLDIEPSVLYALGAGGREDLIDNKTDKVVLFYVDAMGYQRYMDALQKGLVDNMSALGEPIKAVCVYPSVSQTNAKAMATGLAPDLVRGDFRSYLPYNDTMLDILDKKGMRAVWVDGDTAPVKLNDTVYNLDTNKDGSEDDEVADSAIQQYQMGANLTIVHFSDTDIQMHLHGPDSPEAQGALKMADSLIGKIVKNLDNGTVVIVYADHGCHMIITGGNHGTLLPDDMYIPIIIGRV